MRVKFEALDVFLQIKKNGKTENFAVKSTIQIWRE